MKRLFVIGNGFDLLHDLKTTYKEFFHFCTSYFDGLIAELIEYFDHLSIEENWYDFENALSYLNDRKFSDLLRVSKFGNIEQAKEFVENSFSSIKNNLDYLLSIWSFHISNNELQETKKMFSFKSNDYFLTFNYTEVLEILYSIPSDKILHIHGSSADNKNKLIYGHNNTEFTDFLLEEIQTLQTEEDKLDPDLESELTKKIVIETQNLTKPVHKCIGENIIWFENKYEQIIVIGHSYSFVDTPYFFKLFENNKNSQIVFHCHDEKAKEKLEKMTKSIGLNDFQVIDSLEIQKIFMMNIEVL